MIEERSGFAGEILRLARPAREVRVFRGAALAAVPGGWLLPSDARGRLLLEVPGYFR
jgi:hypothetical protein